MDLEKIKELAKKHLQDRKAHVHRERGFIYYHGERTARVAVTLRKLITKDCSNDSILIAASWFHDIAKGIEPHGKYGALLVGDILKPYCTQNELDKIVEAIGLHQSRMKDNAYPEYVKILQDADILDHFGAIEIWMNFNYYANEDGSIKESVQFYEKDFNALAAKNRELLNYEISKQIYDDKIQFINAFTKRMAVESRGEIYNKELVCK